MSELKKKSKSCMYVCPAECAETAAFVNSSDIANSVGKQGMAGYALAYIADLQTKHVFLNKIINYSKKLSHKLDQFFKGNFLKNNLMKYHFTINLNEISSNLDEKI